MTKKKKSELAKSHEADDRKKSKAPIMQVKIHENYPESPLKKLFGSSIDEVNQELASALGRVLYCKPNHDDLNSKMGHAAVLTMMDMKPQNVTEGMLMVQMLANHNAQMECYQRAAQPSQNIEQASFNLGFANKLARTFTAQLEALQRLRGQCGQQKVEVTHLHVHDGGQAIVAGNIERPTLKGAGGEQKREEQPHAKQIENAPSPTMSCFDAQKDRMPISRDD